ncbi:MAG: hypothetical protein CME60_09410 [Halobacteriovoraceae bacterium]|nr:hypothetical protein [Halobacteriovoraceae bacterium]
MSNSFIAILTFVMLATQSTFATCTPSSSLSDLINDPDLKRMLQQPVTPRVDSAPTPTRSEVLDNEIQSAQSDLEKIQSDYRSTPAEKRSAERRLDRLRSEREQIEIDERVAQSVDSEEDSDFYKLIMGQKVTPRTTLSDTPQEVDIDALEGRLAGNSLREDATQFEAPDLGDATQDDLDAFSNLLKQPMITRGQRSSYDNLITDLHSVSEISPLTAHRRNPITGDLEEVSVVEHIPQNQLDDRVRIRVKTSDGRIIHREVRADSLTYDGNDLSGEGGILSSSRYSDLTTEQRAQAKVNAMAREAMHKTDQEEYLRLQAQLDSRSLTIDEMIEVTSRQDDIMRKYSPLRQHEVETIEDNLEGLLAGTGRTLSQSDKRAIAHIREIIDKREGNPRSIEDQAIFERVGDLTENSILTRRMTHARTQVISEIRQLTGSRDHTKLPFELSRQWSSSQVSRAIGGITGKRNTAEAVKVLSDFEKRGQIYDIDQARELTKAIRQLEGDLRGKGATDTPSAQYLEYLKLRIDHYNINLKIDELKL